eukprot:gene16246-22117_t
MEFPSWATPGENRKLYGRAKAKGADALILSDKDATEGFFEEDLSTTLKKFFYLDRKDISGIRKGVYECAASCYAYSAEGEKITIEYDQDSNLHCNILLLEIDQLRRFRRDIRDLCKSFLSDTAILKDPIEVISKDDHLLMMIEEFLYKVEDSSSNDIKEINSVASSALETTVTLTSNPLVTLQMIENPTIKFITGVSLIRCHLISSQQCKENVELKMLDSDENNCIYMSWLAYASTI